jgi:hypothetical protein
VKQVHCCPHRRMWMSLERDQHRDDTSHVPQANNRDCGSINKTRRRRSVISHFLTWLLPVHTTHQRRSWIGIRRLINAAVNTSHKDIRGPGSCACIGLTSFGFFFFWVKVCADSRHKAFGLGYDYECTQTKHSVPIKLSVCLYTGIERLFALYPHIHG